VVGIAGAGDGFWPWDHVRPAQCSCTPSGQSVGARYILPIGAWLWTFFAGWAAWGRFSTRQLGTLGSGHHQPVPDVAGVAQPIPVRSQGLNRRPAIKRYGT